jgi:hypothetical protein
VEIAHTERGEKWLDGHTGLLTPGWRGDLNRTVRYEEAGGSFKRILNSSVQILI